MHAERGFTLAELTIVLLVTGVLAAVAVPRLFGRNDFAPRAAHDFIASSVRYAQKSAIAMRRNVCLDIGGGALGATFAAAPGNDQPCAGANLLTHPVNGLAYADPANALPGGATVAGGAYLIFDSSGRPLGAPSTPLAAALAVTVNGYPLPITIEPETGLVH